MGLISRQNVHTKWYQAFSEVCLINEHDLDAFTGEEIELSITQSSHKGSKTCATGPVLNLENGDQGLWVA